MRKHIGLVARNTFSVLDEVVQQSAQQANSCTAEHI
jgi:hypothetical protein